MTVSSSLYSAVHPALLRPDQIRAQPVKMGCAETVNIALEIFRDGAGLARKQRKSAVHYTARFANLEEHVREHVTQLHTWAVAPPGPHNHSAILCGFFFFLLFIPHKGSNLECYTPCIH